MPLEEQDSQAQIAEASLKLAFRVLGQVGFLTIGLLLIALFGGQALDRLLSTGRLFTISLLLISFPASFYIIYRVALSAVRQIKPVARRRPRAKEEANSDDENA